MEMKVVGIIGDTSISRVEGGFDINEVLLRAVFKKTFSGLYSTEGLSTLELLSNRRATNLCSQVKLRKTWLSADKKTTE